jgi:hypothetical protein
MVRYLVVAFWCCFFALASCAGSSDPVESVDVSDLQESVEVAAEVEVEPVEIVIADIPLEDLYTLPETVVDMGADWGGGEAFDGPMPGEAGYSCAGDGECNSGFCIHTGAGQQCTVSCVEECPFDWLCSVYTPSLPDTVYLCIPPHVEQCRPCNSNEECWSDEVDAGQACLAYGPEGNFCGSSCEANEDCPAGFVCQEATDVSAGVSNHCVQAVGQCSCQPWHADALAGTTCFMENEWGRCYGERVCKATGLTDCDAGTPAADICDGLDNDCDGEVDEESGGGDCFITNQFGSCPGTNVCLDGKLLCDGDEAHSELCDGEDNDCDGDVDEGFEDTDGDGVADCLESDLDGDGIPDIQDNCPGKHNATQIDTDLDNFGDACDADDDNDKTADEDDCAPLDETIHPGAEELCNGQDDNCNSLVDEGFKDTDADGWKDCIDEDDDDDGTVDGEDCEPTQATVHPGAEEVCDGLDNNCDGSTDEGFPDSDEDGIPDCADVDSDGDGVIDFVDNCLQLPNPEQADLDDDGVGDLCDSDVEGDGVPNGTDNCPNVKNSNQADLDGDGSGDLCDDDADGDGVANVEDCGPLDGEINPDADEVCDGIDNNCNDEVDESLGKVSCGKGECAHAVPSCIAGEPASCDPFEGIAVEVCDGKDNDCNGLADEGLGFASCGLGVCAHTIVACADGEEQECDSFAGAGEESCDGLDNDCDGKTDEEQATLACGKGQCFHTLSSCVGGVVKECEPFAGAGPEVCDGIDNDCDGEEDEGLGTVSCGLGECQHEMEYCQEGKVAICNPYLGVALEVCDGFDNDCDGLVDEDLAAITCGLGECHQTISSCVEGEGQSCDPKAGAGDEVCDGLDNDCDGQYDEGLGYKTCGQGICLHTVPTCLDGQEQDCDPYEGLEEEVCDGLDNDCDGSTDPADTTDCTIYYFDGDSDSYGIADGSVCLCEASSPYTAEEAGDCNDDSASVNPGADEDCSTLVDDNCDEEVNESCSWTSCKAIIEAIPAAEDGLYTVDVDGDGEAVSFKAWCDMTTDGGGWTLLMKTATSSNYTYGNSFWTKTEGGSLEGTDPTVDEDYLSPAFYQLKSTESRLALGAQNQWNSWYHAQNSARNLSNQGRMSGSYGAASTCAARTNCGTEPINKRPLGIQEGTSASTSNKWNRFGYVNDVNGWGTRTRVGFTGDNDGSDSSDSVMGIGLECTNACLSGSCTGAAHGKGSGWYLYQSWAQTPYDGNTRGWLWMR